MEKKMTDGAVTKTKAKKKVKVQKTKLYKVKQINLTPYNHPSQNKNIDIH